MTRLIGILLFWIAGSCAVVNAQELATTYPRLFVDSTAIGQQIRHLNYDAALAAVKKEISQARRRKKSTAALERQQAEINRGINFLKGTARVLIVDSVVVGKSEFLSAYHFSHDVGKIRLTDGGRTTEYETERGNRIFRSQIVDEGDSTSSRQIDLYSVDVVNGVRQAPRAVEMIGIDGDLNYPFMMPDGQTFYFASRSESGLGNYDLYVTRYDEDNNRFLRAENLGFPYNSYANDYMLVIDEINGVGWFASDRYQPQDSVCVYTFAPSKSRYAFDYETTNRSELRRKASLLPLSSLWTEDNAAERDSVLLIVEEIKRNNSRQTAASHEFDLVINDNLIYTSLSQFKSSSARELCRRWMKDQKDLIQLTADLDALRDEYAKGNASQKYSMRNKILGKETLLEKLNEEIHNLEKQIRMEELK